MKRFVLLGAIIQLVFASCSESLSPDSLQTCEQYTEIKNALANCVTESFSCILTSGYSFENNSIDYNVVNSVMNSAKPSCFNESDLFLMTKSIDISVEETAISDTQRECISQLMDMTSNGNFSFDSANELVRNHKMSEDESRPLYGLIAITSGIYEGICNIDPLMTKAASPETRGLICEFSVGGIVSIWSSWGVAFAVAAGAAAPVAAATATVVGLFASPILSRAVGCNQ